MRFLSELSAAHDFKLCTQNLTEQAYEQRFDQELVLRFFAFKNNGDEYEHDVSDFMTDYMESVATLKQGTNLTMTLRDRSS